MKLSELIANLKAWLDEHGDGDILFYTERDMQDPSFDFPTIELAFWGEYNKEHKATWWLEI